MWKSFLTKIAIRILVMFAGKAVRELYKEARLFTEDAESHGGGGQEKYRYAYEQLRKRHPNTKESLLNFVIELAVQVLQQHVPFSGR